jgi:peptidyl-dipeptidase A
VPLPLIEFHLSFLSLFSGESVLSAWDFTLNDDVRIKMCTRVAMESFITIHHEVKKGHRDVLLKNFIFLCHQQMGHVEYYLQYKNQPVPFRRGANNGFHEAVGDTIALSASSPKHLHRIGLLENDTDDPESRINQLMAMAIRKIALLPFAYVMDKFRYEAFRGNIQPDNANCHFWRLREKHGGIAPASVRGKHDFDITAKYHISADVEYTRYFVSNIIQFQFHKAVCIKAGEYESGIRGAQNPTRSLSNCDIYQSQEAGNAFK